MNRRAIALAALLLAALAACAADQPTWTNKQVLKLVYDPEPTPGHGLRRGLLGPGIAPWGRTALRHRLSLQPQEDQHRHR